ncbi:peptidase C14 caspase catalytic subunit p20 [Nostoc commune NIES-4072]|uniref:Peptidase C14 caspase catalytic subunit p20 n=1 Tax=Nostoc commune NIES-4072 TaxID=2005467 RepID=A0A2R5FG43_NOSCO|nr:caspase family protein [Nostoc commune]BBD65135.1 peptidase C14 caspase catalytic subunit p20 [Nostoc commune HK-02]GBG17540.1 peptidase C14 caspase catalytic subunit p20 [Nostoc commune NIES-4072]
MANYWAIAIGINQYQLFQPLSCAQADAEALEDFLVTEAGFLPKHCLLMTDTSPPIGDRSTYPTKENILLLLEDLAATSWQPEDYLWLFFSGYGVNYKGKDYLMPAEGNPELVQETGIELRSLMQSLQLAELNVLLLLDINRAFGTQADAPVGEETIELAQELQLATILSCQPEQFSHESSELGHGFFTAVLLEALRSGNGNNLADLESYLSLIMPKVCHHHWRPVQNPATIIPSRQQVILPKLAMESDLQSEPVIYPEESFAVALAAPPLDDYPKTSAERGRWGETTVNSSQQVKARKAEKSKGQQIQESTTGLVSQPMAETSLGVPSGRFIPNSSKGYVSRLPSNQPSIPFWKQFILWGGGSLLVAGLIAVVFLRNQETFKIKQISSTLPNAAASDRTPPVRLKNQSSAQITTSSEPEKRNQAVLDLAKMSLRQTQASDLSMAIATARKIRPGEPLYDQAQENIKIWSEMILDLAEGRAKQRQYASAIAAARLITKDEAPYAKAQAAINLWRLEGKQYVSNKTLLDAANALIKSGQASTYNRAIEVAKKVPPGQPGFDTAQKSINKWSEKILDLAKRRATEGELNAAIATAALVPEETGAYEDAQDAIQKWQKNS